MSKNNSQREKMIRFDDGEFEIAIVTYRRPEFVRGWLEKCYLPSVDRNIVLSIYDSSPDSETENLVHDFNVGKDCLVGYHHIDSDTIIGYKPMIPILKTKAKYLWVSGDARYNDFDQLDKKVFPFIKEQKVDYIVINVSNNRQFRDTIFDDNGEMIHSVFIASTCIGMSIYRTEIFNPIKEDQILLRRYDELFRDNYGFSWLGYFYNVYAAKKCRTLLANVRTFPVIDKRKKESWIVRFYGCWVDDLCQIIDNIPESYTGKESIPKETWAVMKLDSISYGYIARKHGDLNKIKYNELLSEGKLRRIVDNPKGIKFFATAPIAVVEMVYILYKTTDYIKRGFRKARKIISGRKAI